jgi:DNA-binding transcriptional regulator YiaG
MKDAPTRKGKQDKEVKEETTFGDEVIESLNDFFKAVDRGDPITVRTVRLDLRPREYQAEDVRLTRLKLKVSQGVFAKLLAVKVKTVQSWEQGERPPKGPVCRLLDDMNQDPQRWMERLKRSVRRKV